MRDFDPDEEESPEERRDRADEDQRREEAEARRRHKERFDAAEARLAEQRAERQAETSRSRGRTVMLLAGGLVLCVGAFVAYSVLSLRERASADVSGQLSAFRGTGLSLAVAVPSKQGAPLTHGVDIEGCAAFVAVGPKGPVDVSVTRAGGAVLVGKRVAICTCALERISIAVPDHDPKLPPGSGAIGVLTGTAELTGGLVALKRVPREGLVFGEAPPADCQEAQLDAWLGRPTPEEPSEEAKKSFPAIRGATVVSHAGADTAFATLQTSTSSCYLAVGTEAVKLRGTGGTILAEGKTIALCDAGSTKVWLKPPGGAVTGAAVDAAKVGGLLGVVEAAVGAGLPRPAVYLAPATAKTQPKTMLLASGMLAANIETPDSLAAGPLLRAVALAHDGADVRDAKLACSPPWPSPVAICMLPPGQPFSGSAQSLRLAVAPLSGISGALSGSKEPAAAVAASHLLALARRLARDGFETTMMESS